MTAEITTVFNSTAEKLWSRIGQPSSLQYVSAPILYFFPENGTDLNAEWQTGQEYRLKLYMFKFIPLGGHRIVLKKIDTMNNEIISSESGLLAKTWNHTIRFRDIDGKRISYTDIIEIRAGILTFAVLLFSLCFYRHRQRRWKRLLAADKNN